MRPSFLIPLGFSAVLVASCSSTSTNSEGTGATGGVDPGQACADASNDQVYDADMVGCDGASGQCLAETLCATGWHLCPFSEYVAHGGDQIKATKERWLRSCVREVDDAQAKCPTEVTCGTNCGLSALEEVPMGWTCEGTVLDKLTDGGVGVTTSPSSPTRKAGCTDAVCAYVRLTVASYGYGTDDPIGATCCRD